MHPDSRDPDNPILVGHHRAVGAVVVHEHSVSASVEPPSPEQVDSSLGWGPGEQPEPSAVEAALPAVRALLRWVITAGLSAPEAIGHRAAVLGLAFGVIECDQTELAKRQGVTKQAVQKLLVDLSRHFGVPLPNIARHNCRKGFRRAAPASRTEVYDE